MPLDPVPNVPLLEDTTKDAIFKRWLEQIRNGATTSTTGLAAHIADTSAAHVASAIGFTPAGNIAATDVQAAIAELDAEKQPLDSDLTAIAALTTTTYGRSLLTLADEDALEGSLDTLPNLVSIQGRTVTLADAGANAIFGWDDVAGAYENLSKAEAQGVLGLVTVSVDNTVPRFDGITGSQQTSGVTIDDSNIVTASGFVGPLTGNVSGDVTGNAGTVTWANEATDTTCFIGFATAASGSLAPKTNANMTFNSSTGVATFASTVLTTTDINGGTVDGAVIGGASAAAGSFTTLAASGNTTLTGDIAVNGGDMTSSATTFNMLSAGVTTLNIGMTSATTMRLGAVSASWGFSDAVSAAAKYHFGGTYASTGAGIVAAGVLYNVDVTGFAGDTSYLSQLSNTGTITTQGAAETIALVASFRIAEPAITVGAGDTITLAATMHIANAPTEGVTNAALSIGAGNFLTAGDVHIGSVTTPAGNLDVSSTTGGVLSLRRIDAAIVANDVVGKLQFYARDDQSTTNSVVANIEAQATNTITTDINPGRLIFRTTPTAVAAVPLDRLWIAEDGSLQQYAIFTSSTDYSRLAHKVATTTVTAAVGATVTATSLIPAKARVVGVNTKVTVALGTSTGTTGYQVGDGTDADRWGNKTGTATTTDTDGNDATADPAGWFTAANNVVITANGGNFDGTGSIRIDVFYTLTEAD